MVEIKNDLINSVNVGNLIADEINVGAHLTSVQSKYCGIASTIFDDHGPKKIMAEAGTLESLPLTKLINFLKSDILLKASTGMAALNSVIVPPDKYETGNAFQMIKSKSARKNLGIIGHFHFVNRFSDSVKNCWVFEKSPRDDDIPADKIGEFLPKCDVVVITGQTIINNTLAEILSYSQKAFKIMLGPSVPLSPVLFDHGVDVLAGVKILKSDLVNRFIRQGANFRQLQGVELVMMGKNKI
jgi:uncharacterized protein (DUF4213/DUF364 family)